MRSVARRVGVAAPSIYRHFPDRPAIVLAVGLVAAALLLSRSRSTAAPVRSGGGHSAAPAGGDVPADHGPREESLAARERATEAQRDEIHARAEQLRRDLERVSGMTSA